MNLIITDYCNRSCPYCFAREKVELASKNDNANPRHISMENAEIFVTWLERNRKREFKLLGGEPSLHPHLPEIVELGLKRGLMPKIFTNGLWPDHIQDFFRDCRDSRVGFVFNINEPFLQENWECELQHQCLEIAGDRAILSFNIYHKDFNLLFMAKLFDDFSLKREFRLGLAHPVARNQNKYLEKDSIKPVGESLIQQLQELEAQDILVGFDCGFPLCMFSEQDLGKLLLCSTSGFVSVCGSVLDVGPDLTVWPCFPLSGVWNVRLQDFQDEAELRDYYDMKMAPLKSFGIMDDCMTCRFLHRGQCSGGCIAHMISNWEETGDPQLLEKLECLE